MVSCDLSISLFFKLGYHLMLTTSWLVLRLLPATGLTFSPILSPGPTKFSPCLFEFLLPVSSKH
ncbi:MAG: hypothetical protein U5L72_18100 [Bacteroidales bacterium]|nr:hypothetical protein [Bacteroidales bacterium]